MWFFWGLKRGKVKMFGFGNVTDGCEGKVGEHMDHDLQNSSFRTQWHHSFRQPHHRLQLHRAVGFEMSSIANTLALHPTIHPWISTHVLGSKRSGKQDG